MQKNQFSNELTKLAMVSQAMERYKISRKTLMTYAKYANAVVYFGRSVRIDITLMDKYIKDCSQRKSHTSKDTLECLYSVRDKIAACVGQWDDEWTPDETAHFNEMLAIEVVNKEIAVQKSKVPHSGDSILM